MILRSVAKDPESYIHNEWLVTNGLGGYSSGTILGVTTRKYHGLLIAALPPPYGRYIMLNNLREEAVTKQSVYHLNGEETPDGTLNVDAFSYLKDFYLEDGLPLWRYQIEDHLIEKRLFMPNRQNTVIIRYELLEGNSPIFLRLYPAIHFRHHEAEVNTPLEGEYVITVIGQRYEVSKKDFTPIRLVIFGAESEFTLQKRYLHNIFFRIERRRGYECTGDLWNPGFLNVELKKNNKIEFIASTESWKNIDAFATFDAWEAEQLRRRLLVNLANAQDDLTKELVLASDQFIIVPEHRIEDTVRANAFGEEIRTIIAGYHWFTDWGRDTMISLEGLTLCNNRFQEARWILKTFAHYVHNGLIPNMFPEGEKTGLYHTADATLWFFHALDRYLSVTQDFLTLEELMHTLITIMQFHIRGTDFGIGMDPEDKLLKQGVEKFQLTWMDAKVGDWVVTPRRGKSVEINSLWYNALKLMEEWTHDTYYGALAQTVQESFNKRFWIPDQSYLYDVIDGEKGNDSAFRPNQIFSISLKYPVLESARWQNIVDQVKQKLLTPFGLRTLSVDHPDFKPNYEGDLRSRDAAYHQGTVWPWLLGPFIDAWLKTYPKDTKAASSFLEGFSQHLGDAGMGSIGEIFDATYPFIPKGCIAQAWSVAEFLRSWLRLKTES